MRKKRYKLPLLRWCVQSWRFYGWRHLVFALTVALCAAILSAALGTGNSLRAGLLRDLRARLGEARSGVIPTGGLFPVSLAERVPRSEAALMLRGEMLDSEGVVCADRVNIFGVLPAGGGADGDDDDLVAVNTRAAEILSSLEQSTWSYRFEKPSHFSVELPLGSGVDDNTGRSFATGVYSARHDLIPADYDSSPASVPPVNVRVPYARLAAEAGVPGSANLLLSRSAPDEFKRQLQETLTAEDIGLRFSQLENGRLEIKSREVFLPESFCRTLRLADKQCGWAVFHLIDDFSVSSGTNSSPYGFAAAITPDGGVIPQDMAADEIIINRWLADTLGVAVGDRMLLKWRRFEGGELTPDERSFKIRGVIGIERARALKERMPIFPGLEGADSCADWDIGMPVDKRKLRDKANEEYWKQFRETPKVLLTYATGKECFGTAFGEAMSVRVTAERQDIEALIKDIDAAELGFNVRALWDEGVAAASGSTDFRGLFVGMMFILMVSALALAGLTLGLALDSRAVEPALFSALGVERVRVAGMLFAEWGSVSIVGALAGGFCGTALARMLIRSLARFWHDAFAGARIQFFFSLSAVLYSVLFTSVVLCLILAIRIYRYCGVAPVEILKQAGTPPVLKLSSFATLMGRIGGVSCALGAALIIWSSSGSRHANAAFFAAGFLMMISLLLFFKGLSLFMLARFSSDRAVVSSAFRAGLARAFQAGRRGSSLAVLLAVGFFLTVGMLAMKHDPAANFERSSSGSGGFAAIVRSTSSYTLHSGIELAKKVTGSEVAVPVRVRDGDEASCVNMNVAGAPRLFGVPVDQMAALRAFEPEASGGIWSVLRDQPEAGVIPALASDQAMLRYSLKMRAGVEDGDELSYRGSDGRQWRIRIVGVLPVRVTILQGALLLNNEHFTKMFPGEGYRMWLTDYAPYALRVDNSLEARYPRPGVQAQSTERRLRTLGRVESSYLDMFLVLGGLGLALGVVGVALVIARSIEERRYEFAVLQAVGIAKQRMLSSIVTEFGVLTLSGVVCGLIPALVAVRPAARSLSSGVNWALVFGVVLGFVLSALFSVTLGAFYALRRFDVSLLKRE